MTSLALIRGLARAGATQRAWALFEAEGYEARSRDSDALTLKGRLLKDRARLASGPERVRLYGESESAYAQAAALAPATYPLINAATVALLAGKGRRAQALAGKTLALLDGGNVQGETPYWIAATRAEALLIMGKTAEARRALAEAMKEAPEAWEDHASTLRQFESLLTEQGEDAAWLDRHRPPASLHFSGILGVAPDDARAAAEIEEAVLAVKPGFGFGALAAGADILIAEALIRQGGSLHVVLPCPVERFRAQSVVGVNEAWGPRFDALIEAAERIDTPGDYDILSPATIGLADEMAMGLALRQARMMDSRAVALRLRDRADGEGSEAAADALWQRAGRLVSLPVTRAIAAPSLPDAPALANMAFAAVDKAADVRLKADWEGECSGYRLLGFADPAAAADAAQAIAGMAQGGGRIGLDYVAADPADPSRAPLERLLLVTAGGQGGIPVATAPLALALALHAPQFHCEPAGEIKANIGDIPYWNIWASRA